MNKNNVDKAIFLTAGLCIGGGLGYILAKKRYRLLAEEEIASVKEVFKRVADEKAARLDSDGDSDSDVGDTDEQVYAEVIEASGYNGTSHPSDDESSSEVQEVEVNIDEQKESLGVRVTLHQTEADFKHPYLIPTMEFMVGEQDFDKVSLTYWAVDGVLVDEAEEKVRDELSMVGNEYPTMFDTDPSDPNTVYVRNEHLRADFEIIRVNKSYAEVVMGVPNYDERDARDQQRPKKMRGDG